MKKILLTLAPLLLLLTAKAQTTDTAKKAAKTNAADVILDAPIATGEPNDRIFTSVEVEPQFPGGIDAFGRFLGTHIHYPAAARKNRIQGRVIVTMVVEKDGSVSDVKIARGVSDDIDAEAMRVIKSSPKWSPGIQNGRPVRVSYAVPISFTLDK